MDIVRYRAFVAAAETSAISKAAELLNYTPSGVSQLIQALENELNLLLLTRNKRGVSLTADGKRILPAVRSLLQQEERIFQIANDINGLSVGSISIATYSSIATHWLPKVIRAFKRDYPQIEIELREGIRSEVVSWLDQCKADIGFLSFQENMPYDWLPLGDDPLIAVIPRTHPFASSERYPLENIPKENFIMPAMGHDEDVVPLFEENNITPVIGYSTIETFSAMSLIENGLGMTVTNSLITKGRKCDVAMLPLDPPRVITLGAAVPSMESASPAVKKFLEYAVRIVKDLQPQDL